MSIEKLDLCALSSRLNSYTLTLIAPGHNLALNLD